MAILHQPASDVRGAGHRAGNSLRQALLACGIVSSLLWPIVCQVSAAWLWPGYSSFSQTISELTLDTVLMLSILGFGAAALGRHFRIYSLLTVAVVLAGGASTFAFVSSGGPAGTARHPSARRQPWHAVPLDGGAQRSHRGRN